MTLLHWCKINSIAMRSLNEVRRGGRWWQLGGALRSLVAAAPIIIKINDDKKKLVGCEDSTASKQASVQD